MRKYFMQSERIGFSLWSSEDIELAKSLWKDSKVTMYITAKGYFSDEEVNQRLNNEIELYQNYGVQYFPIFDIQTNEFIGCCGLRPYDLNNQIYEIGFHLGSNFLGKGLGPEAAKRMIEYAFTDRKVNALFAGHHPKNFNSKKVLERLGFSATGEVYYEPTGLMHPSYIYKR